MMSKDPIQFQDLRLWDGYFYILWFLMTAVDPANFMIQDCAATALPLFSIYIIGPSQSSFCSNFPDFMYSCYILPEIEDLSNNLYSRGRKHFLYVGSESIWSKWLRSQAKDPKIVHLKIMTLFQDFTSHYLFYGLFGMHCTNTNYDTNKSACYQDVLPV